MTNRKLLVIVGLAIATLLLIVALVGGAIVGTAFYTIDNSEAAQTAKTFLRRNEKLKADIGEVRNFGWFVTGSINAQDAGGGAELKLKVIGARRTVPATVALVYRNGGAWRVTGASYVGADGRVVKLFDPYEQTVIQDEPAESDKANDTSGEK
jgi:hypothetical protein